MLTRSAPHCPVLNQNPQARGGRGARAPPACPLAISLYCCSVLHSACLSLGLTGVWWPGRKARHLPWAELDRMAVGIRSVVAGSWLSHLENAALLHGMGSTPALPRLRLRPHQLAPIDAISVCARLSLPVLHHHALHCENRRQNLLDGCSCPTDTWPACSARRSSPFS